MENATKALLIAAGMMVAIMILSLLMMGYNQISSYYANQSEMEATKQLTDFNETFEAYNRKNIRGTDLITLMNKVIDYNERFAYADEKKYKRIKVNIEIDSNGVNNVWKNNFMYNTTDTPIITPNNRITNAIADSASVSQKRNADQKLIAVTNVETTLQNTYPSLNLTSSKLQKLAANISNLILDADGRTLNKDINVDADAIQKRTRRVKLIKDILNVSISGYNEATGNANSTGQSQINIIQNITRQYYQFTQFKRAYFDCTEVKYDNKTGRICEMNFNIQLGIDETGNKVVVFN